MSYPKCFPPHATVAVHAADLLAAAGVRLPGPTAVRAARPAICLVWWTGSPPTIEMLTGAFRRLRPEVAARLADLAVAYQVPFAVKSAVAA